MLENYLKISLRNLYKNRIFVLINVLGMGMAIACCIVAYLNFRFYHDHDGHNTRIDEIYRLNVVEKESDRLIHYGMTPFAIETELKKINGLDEISRYQVSKGTIQMGTDLFGTKIGFVDAAYPSIFTIPMIYGAIENLDEKNYILINDRLSLKLFNELNSVGKTLSFLDNGKEKEWVIGGVFEEQPLNSSTNFEALTSIKNYLDIYDAQLTDWNNSTTFFFTFMNGIIPSDLDNQMAELTKFHQQRIPNKEILNYYADPLKGMAARAYDQEVVGPFGDILPWPIVAVVAFISLLILLISSFTFINTAIASSANRIKEVGIRKVIGGSRATIIWQFITENLLVCILSLIIAIPLSTYLSSEFNQLFPKAIVDLHISDDINFVFFLLVLVGSLGILAGGYPAVYLSRFQPSKILKGNFVFGQVGRLSKFLLYIQLCFTMLTIISSVLFIQNAFFQDGIDLGFDTDETVVIRLTNGSSDIHVFRERLAQNPKVLSITGSADHVGRRNYFEEVTVEDRQILIAGMDVGADYLKVMELNLIAGRDFDYRLQSDFNEGVIVNEEFVKTMKWKDPIGKRITYSDTLSCRVIGVVKDFYYDTFNSEVLPLSLRFIKPIDYRYLVAKTKTQYVPQLEEESKVLWNELFQGENHDIKTGMHARFESTYTNAMILKIFVFMGSIATILSLIGLFSLISMHLSNRTKEIGIRKILGAHLVSILVNVNKTYVIIILLGLSTGALISFFVTPTLMDSIWAYHVKINLWIIAISIVTMTLFTFLTILWKVKINMSLNPIELLRQE